MKGDPIRLTQLSLQKDHLLTMMNLVTQSSLLANKVCNSTVHQALDKDTTSVSFFYLVDFFLLSLSRAMTQIHYFMVKR